LKERREEHVADFYGAVVNVKVYEAYGSNGFLGTVINDCIEVGIRNLELFCKSGAKF
jgi:hypothetical protein